MISFIVPVKDQLPYTRALVESVQAGNPGQEVEWIIVDSGSTDGTQAWCAEIGARIVPFSRRPFHYCEAINAGAAESTGHLWVIANNDIEFRSQGDLARIESLFADWPILGALSPGRPDGQAHLEFRLEGVNGACWVVRPSAFRAWGGMPESMSGYGYDEMWTAVQCWRNGMAHAWLTGWDVFHHGSVTFGPLAGNVTPALRRNLSRLLAALGAEDLDAGHPNAVLGRLRARELGRAKPLLRVEGTSHGLQVRQGLAGLSVEAGAPRATATDARVQWAPWLANELLLQPDADSVGGHWGTAVRRPGGPEPRSVGPPPPPLMPAIPLKRPTLRQRVVAALHAWRQRGRKLPEGW